jgi:hypothetical protein
MSTDDLVKIIVFRDCTRRLFTVDTKNGQKGNENEKTVAHFHTDFVFEKGVCLLARNKNFSAQG